MATTTQIAEPKLSQEIIAVDIVGLSPLLQHNWSEEAIESLPGGQGKKTERKECDPEAEAKACLYLLNPKRDGTEYGHPAIAFKLAMVAAARNTDWKMTDLRQAFHVLGGPEDQRLPIRGVEWERHSVPARINRGGVVLRHRALFPVGWEATLEIQFNPGAINEEEIAYFVDAAGAYVGVGDWRPAKDGDMGRFQIKR